VLDAYEGFRVERFVALTESELEAYLDRNVAALQAATEWHRPDVVVAGHVVPGGIVAARALGPGRTVVKAHGSDIEYAMKLDVRYAELAREALDSARAVVGGSADVLERALRFTPNVMARTAVVAPGVDVEHFRLRPRRESLLELADLLDRDPETARGRPSEMDRVIEEVLAHDPPALDAIATSYDQDVPDPGAANALRALAAPAGPIVGYLGKLIPPKGVELFIQALALSPVHVQGLVVGFGSRREWLQALVLSLDAGPAGPTRWLGQPPPSWFELAGNELTEAKGLADRIRFTGRLDHRFAPFALAAMDILVVPSILEEAFGMVAAEGAACGALPLVARHSGLAEVSGALEAQVGRPGLFSFEPGPGAAHRIAEGIDRLLGVAASERAELREAVSSFASREWTWDRTAARLLEAGS
jgi:glycosyltransferase involved in cell wall biosynthesis